VYVVLICMHSSYNAKCVLLTTDLFLLLIFMSTSCLHGSIKCKLLLVLYTQYAYVAIEFWFHSIYRSHIHNFCSAVYMLCDVCTCVYFHSMEVFFHSIGFVLCNIWHMFYRFFLMSKHSLYVMQSFFQHGMFLFCHRVGVIHRALALNMHCVLHNIEHVIRRLVVHRV